MTVLCLVGSVMPSTTFTTLAPIRFGSRWGNEDGEQLLANIAGDCPKLFCDSFFQWLFLRHDTSPPF
jgi:hypothetical protein